MRHGQWIRGGSSVWAFSLTFSFIHSFTGWAEEEEGRVVQGSGGWGASNMEGSLEHGGGHLVARPPVTTASAWMGRREVLGQSPRAMVWFGRVGSG